MFLTAKRAAAQQARVEALAAAIRCFDHPTRRALYAASNKGVLRRRTWDGCALNRAGAELGVAVSGQGAASKAFNVPQKNVIDFIAAWDKLHGSNERCTAVLRETILAVGLFPETGIGERAGDLLEASRAAAWTRPS
jgi:hypothetical protein